MGIALLLCRPVVSLPVVVSDSTATTNAANTFRLSDSLALILRCREIWQKVRQMYGGKLRFEKVTAHASDYLNESAGGLAKHGCFMVALMASERRPSAGST